MMKKDFEKAVAQGKMFLMRKYKACGEYGVAKLVSAEVAARKAKVFVKSYDEFDSVQWHCPYSFEIAE